MSVDKILIEAILSGDILGFANTLALNAASQTGLDIIGGVVFTGLALHLVTINPKEI